MRKSTHGRKTSYTAQRFKLSNRRGFGLREEIADSLVSDYHSPLVRWMREHDYRLVLPHLTFVLAKEFGFCYGVDGAVQIAYETCRRFPDKRKFITTEIIHNPRVNLKLREMGVEFLSGQYSTGKTLADISAEDVVILPAFGARLPELEALTEKGCILVDTTCASVMNVWKRVEQYAREKPRPSSTASTSTRRPRRPARVVAYPGAHHLVVLDKAQTQIVCDYIRNGGDRRDFLATFRHAHSPGFDPDLHLSRLGVANQTTMLSSESQAIAVMLQQALVDRYGPAEGAARFRNFDTICSATQERQDAMLRLAEEKPDLILVLGGYNSSNTNHLAEMAHQHAPTFHICEPACIRSRDEIHHKPVGGKEAVVSRDWFPQGPVKIGLTAGASTPDRVVEDAIVRLARLCGIEAIPLPDSDASISA
ncbi:4-hydroxy-3-methylbut-2-enyl diphosphate reductase [bacterium]|nr:4-hydroxy-3-methylbut-2-enyl diphosphate reductase [bacterium]